MSFDYEQSVWGLGVASLNPFLPTSFRLKQSLGALKKLKREAKVLEVGCGAGQFIRAIKKNRPDLYCYGSDISSKAIIEAKKNDKNINFFLTNGYQLPFDNEFLDAALVFDVLEHLASPASMLKEIRRVLKPDGVFYAFVPCEGDFLSLWRVLDKIGLKNKLTKKYAGHVQYFSRADLKQLFSAERFAIKTIRYSEHFLGQILGVVAFYLMDRAAKKSGEKQLNNEAYFSSHQSDVVKLIKKILNFLIYTESFVLRLVPSPNIHFVVIKKDL